MKILKKVLNLKLIDDVTGGMYILGRIDYVSLLWIKSYLAEISKKKNPFYKIIKLIILKRLNSFFHELKLKQKINPNDLLEFKKFYLSTKNHEDSDYISGTVTSIDQKYNTEYFKLRLNTNTHKKNKEKYVHVFVEISSSPSIHPNISILRTINDNDGQRTVSVERAFVDTNEDYEYYNVWMMICRYIKLVMETDWENEND